MKTPSVDRSSPEPESGLKDPALERWANAIDAFPLCGSESEKLTNLVRFAILAPSSHNSQPWQFQVREDRLELWADPSRSLPVTDPSGRELAISCGAALGCLEIALHHFGYDGDVALVPEPREPDVLAHIRLGGEREPSTRDHEFFHAMLKRRTNREPFLPTVVEGELLDELERIVEGQGVGLRIVQSESSRQTLVELITEGDRAQIADQSFRRELAAWMHPNRSKSRDGMPGSAFGMGEIESWVAPLIIRTFDIGGGLAAHDEDLAMGSPVLAILSSPLDSRRDWVQTGRALAHLLARAAIDGVAASFLNQPIEVAGLRLKVEALIGSTCFPQLILRLGHPKRPARDTPRRPVSEVLGRSD